MGLKAASREFFVPRSTLQRRLRKNGTPEKCARKGLGSRNPVFSEEMELELVKHIKEMESMLFGFTTDQLRKVTYNLLNNIHGRFSQEKKEAGLDWLKGFLNRHSDALSLRTPEMTSAARAAAFNETNVNAFYDLLDELQD